MADYFKKLLRRGGVPEPEYRYEIWKKGSEYHIKVWRGNTRLDIPKDSAVVHNKVIADWVVEATIRVDRERRAQEAAPYVLHKAGKS